MHSLKKTGMKFLSVVLAIGMLASLSACGKEDNDAADALKERLKNAQSEQEEKEAKPKFKKKKEAKEEKSEEQPEASNPFEIYVQQIDDSYYGDSFRALVVDFSYEQIDLGESSKKDYPELAKSLAVANDVFATEAENAYQEAVDATSGMTQEEVDADVENGLLPNKRESKIYVRRTDPKAFSFVNISTYYAVEDYNYVKTYGHSYDPVSGKEYELSDIVADEDALFELLAKKGKPILEQEARDYYGYETEFDPDTLPDMMKKNLKEAGSWVLDPQGISFWFDSYSFSPGRTTISLLFCEDTDHTIFQKEWADSIPDTWCMEVPTYVTTDFDMEDDGKTDTLYLGIDYSWEEDYNYEYISGMNVILNDNGVDFPADTDPYNHRFDLIHRDGTSVIIAQYDEYDDHYMQAVKIDGREPELGDYICGGPIADIDFDTLPEHAYMLPRRVITDPAHIPTAVNSDMLCTGQVKTEYAIEANGDWKQDDKRMEYFSDYQYTVTLKVPFDDLKVVDEKTGEETGATLDLLTGDELTMLYTDNETFVDCMTADGLMVRIPFGDDPEYFRCVIIDGENVDIWDVFDGMMFAG